MNRFAFGAASAISVTTFASGRTRSTNHAGFEASPNFGPARTASFAIDETSGFLNAVVTLPGTVLGGRLNIGGFIGYAAVDATTKLNADVPIVINGDLGKAEINSLMYGATALWSMNRTYVLGSVAGLNGEASVRDRLSYGGFKTEYFNFDTRSTIVSATIGHWLALTDAKAGGLNLDLRSGVARTQAESGEIGNAALGPQYKSDFSHSNINFSAMLFSDFTVAGGMLRPYVQGKLKKLFDYSFTAYDYNIADTYRFDQSRLYSGVELGVNYAVGSLTFGAAGYYEGASDEQTWGGKLGVSYKLN